MIKYVSNAFLAVKISYANEIGNVCKVLNIDSAEVFKGVGLDKRINPSFFGTGIGFGGSCFPKDLKAFIASAKNLGLDTKILQSVVEVNEEQPLKVISLLKKHLPDLQGVRVGVLGLAFKPGTDDIRESRAIPIIESLLQQGVTIRAYDPKAMDNFRKQFPMITYCTSAEEVLDCDALLILTEWEEFKDVDYTGKLVIDGRRIENAKKNASVYEGVCW
jgi:UDPglucose 6-dehydrogenase